MSRKHSDRRNRNSIAAAAAFEALETRQMFAGNPGLYFAQLPTLYTMQTAALPHAYADLNGDGKVDMIRSTASGPNAVAVLLGAGAGEFANPVYYRGGSLAADIEIADINNDGKPDVLQASNTEKSITVLRGNGDGTLTYSNTVTFGDIAPTDTSLVDFTHDGKLDLVICGYSHGFPLEGVIGTMEGNGDGTFGALKTYIPSFQTPDTAPFGVCSGDFNGDGWTDFVTTHRATQPGFQVYLNNHDGTFAQQTISMMAYPGFITAADFNNDGIGDWATPLTSTPQFGSSQPALDIAIGIGNGDGTFSVATYQLDTDRDYLMSGASNVAVGDLDGDGELDVAFTGDAANGSGSFTRILRGDGNGHFTPGAKFANGASNMAIEDINQDGANDLIAAWGGSSAMARFLGSPTSIEFFMDPSKVYDAQPAQGIAGVIAVDDGFDAQPDYVWYRADDLNTALPAAPSDVGDYVVKASYAGDAYHAPSSATTTYSITQATPTLSWTIPQYAPFTGNPIEAFGTVTGADSQVIGAPAFTYYNANDTTLSNPLAGAPTAKGSYAVVARFGGNQNYVAAEEMREYQIIGAESFVVTTTADELDVNASPDLGTGTSLREALQYADAHPGADTITFAPSLAGNTISLTSGWNGDDGYSALGIVSDVTIEGNGVTLSIPSGTQRRIMSVVDGANLIVSKLTFAKGNSPTGGGAIENSGSLTVRNCTFANNHASIDGGAIRSAYGVGSVLLQNCTFAGNSAQEGSAISTGSPSNQWDHLTVVDNSTPYAGSGALRIFQTSVKMRDSIVARNTNDGLDTWAGGGTFAAGSTDNIVGSGSWTGLSASTNSLNVGASTLKIGALADNGGPTLTVALLPGSPAINAAAVIDGVSTDQRGVSRPQGSAPDIGAFERQATVATISGESYEYLTRQAVTFNFSADASVIFSRSDITLTNTTTGQTINTGGLSFDASGTSATLLLTNQLSDGNYTLSTTSGLGGSPLSFFVLAGDANHDRKVDIVDLGILAGNWQGSGSKNFSQGDFNYDGKVDIVDLGTIASNWQTALPTTGAAAATSVRGARSVAARPARLVDLVGLLPTPLPLNA